MRRKNIRTLIFSAASLLFNCLYLEQAGSVPYNEKHAFCADKLSINLSQYENTKRYNKCMRNVHDLIREHEEKKEKRRLEWEQGRPERERKRKRALQEQRKNQILKDEQYREEQQRKREEQQKELHRVNSLWDQFE